MEIYIRQQIMRCCASLMYAWFLMAIGNGRWYMTPCCNQWSCFIQNDLFFIVIWSIHSNLISYYPLFSFPSLRRWCFKVAIKLLVLWHFVKTEIRKCRNRLCKNELVRIVCKVFAKSLLGSAIFMARKLASRSHDQRIDWNLISPVGFLVLVAQHQSSPRAMKR